MGTKKDVFHFDILNRPIYFNSFSSNQRGLMVLLKDSMPAKNVKMENILLGDYSWLTLSLGDTKVLIKCCYAPNDDMSPLDSSLKCRVHIAPMDQVHSYTENSICGPGP